MRTRDTNFIVLLLFACCQLIMTGPGLAAVRPAVATASTSTSITFDGTGATPAVTAWHAYDDISLPDVGAAQLAAISPPAYHYDTATDRGLLKMGDMRLNWRGDGVFFAKF